MIAVKLTGGGEAYWFRLNTLGENYGWMSKNWAICIGINNYDFVGKLKYAQADAQQMRDCCRDELGFDGVFYFAEDAPDVELDYGESVGGRPTFGNLDRFLQVQFQQRNTLNPQDSLWFFFAGHGVRSGDVDYLLPIDGNDKRIEQTGLKINYIAERLRRCGAGNIVLMLDACRDGDARSAVRGIGEKPPQQGVVSFYACSPNEQSYECKDLGEEGQGVFTYALLEGLRLSGPRNCATVDRLQHWLEQRVKELNRQHKKPRQTPILRLEPSHKQYLVLLPDKATIHDTDPLRKEALMAEVNGDLKLARQLWINVLSVVRADLEAIKALERIANKKEMSLDGTSETDEGTRLAQSLPLDTDIATISSERETSVKINSVSEREMASHVEVVPSQSKEPEKPLLIIDRQVAEYWNVEPEEVLVHRGKNLAEIDESDLSFYLSIWDDIQHIEPEHLLLPQLTFIDHFNDHIPAAIAPKGSREILFLGKLITPLLPVNSILLDYFTPEELAGKLTFKTIDVNEHRVEVTLELPLRGIDSSRTEMSVLVKKTYQLQEDNALAGVPVLEVWPNFRTAVWNAYYLFYYDAALGRDTFSIEKISRRKHVFQDSEGGSFSIAEMNAFPGSIVCQDESKEPIGIILIKQPEEVSVTSDWTIGVDYNNEYAHFAFNDGTGVSTPSSFSCHLRVTDSPLETRLPVLLEYFIPENFIPAEAPFPIQTILSVQGARYNSQDIGSQPVLDGRIYIPNLYSFDSNAEWLASDVWNGSDLRTLNAHRLFLKNLLLYIAAIAASSGVKSISWKVSYPKDFSRNELSLFARLWHDCSQEISQLTGIARKISNNPKSSCFVPRELAFARYIDSLNQTQPFSAVCVEIRENTTHLSVWENDRSVYRCSLHLGQKELLANVIARNHRYIPGLENFGLHELTLWLRHHSQRWLEEERAYLNRDSGFQATIRIIAIGIAGLHYYIGCFLNRLKEEGQYTCADTTPIYIGGEGVRILDWLDYTGQFTQHSEVNDLLSYMLSLGAGTENETGRIIASQKPRDEVVCGLAQDNPRLKFKHVKQDIFSDEPQITSDSVTNNNQWSASESITTGITTSHLNRLVKFVYDYHTALKRLKIESVPPIIGYVHSLNPKDNANLWAGVLKGIASIFTEQPETRKEGTQTQPPFIVCLVALLNYLSEMGDVEPVDYPS